ncbi:MAG: chromosome segregation protein SMC [Deltaproteobacteria bacterium CG2_30_63_29]|nr:MAG: chromosome segregation protein SMC [Deltaproteobacteria bacterium CG2_30_63_29]PJB35103.1 MAG: chromosome segregation protein SMC [Deltaproteobacteria bacterium CG_4_9_14_3_um_filter_63_12]
MFIESLRLDGLLSFAPGTPEFTLQPLNVIIGPNGSGKSNLIEAMELLRATPTAFASAIRDGGGVREWLWKGEAGVLPATLDVRLGREAKSALRYRLSFTAVGARVEVVDEAIEEAERNLSSAHDVYFYYRFQGGHPVLNVREAGSGTTTQRRLQRESLVADESVLSQRKDPDLYPELTWCSNQFTRIQSFREWSFGRYAALRQPQPADLPTDVLLPDARNLGLILNQLEHSDTGPELNLMLRRFLPRFRRVSTLVQAGSVQFFLHEDGLKAPVPATRLSDGTIRFLAMSAQLLMPNPAPLICIDEPELGLHPDALSLVAELLIDASARTQVIVTTHSDALVSALTEHLESVLICEHQDGTQLTRLEAGPLNHWLETYRLGDLWRMGELGGNP